MGWVLCVGPEPAIFSGAVANLAKAGIATHSIAHTSADALKRLVELIGKRPGLAIIDQRIASNDDLALGHEIKKDAGEPAPYIITLLDEKTSGEESIHAYDCGADMVMRGPIDAQELTTAVQQILERRQYVHGLTSQLSAARSAAFTAMATSSRIGQIVRFMQQAMEADSGDAVANGLYDIMCALDLRGSLFIDGPDGQKYYVDASHSAAEDERRLRLSDSSQRLIEIDGALIVRDQHCALIVSNFYQFDESNRGQLRDDLCILIEAIESRICGLLLEKEGQRRRSLVDISVRVLSRILDETDIFNRQFTDDSTRIITTMTHEINEEFSAIDLKEEEEERLLKILEASSGDLHSLFESKRHRDNILREILEKLFATLSA